MKAIRTVSVFSFLTLFYSASLSAAQDAGPSASTTTSSARPAPTAPFQPDVVGDYNWYGCKTEASAGRALKLFGFADDSMTLESCRDFCDSKGTIFFGTEYGRECFCGNKFEKGSVDAPDSDCSMLCAGDQWNFCGNGNRLSVYIKDGAADPAEPSASTTTSNAQPAPTAPFQPDVVSDYNWYGCKTEASAGRALKLFGFADDSMTLESCRDFCDSKGTIFFGAEYGRECFCGDKFESGSVDAPDSDCSMRCAGDEWNFCGNGNRLSVYIKDGAADPAPSDPPDPPQPPAEFPEGWTDQGCWQDGPNGRIMPTYQAPDNSDLTQESCAQLCFDRGYKISGTEYFRQCFCSNAIYNGGTPEPDESKCTTPCEGDPEQMCGGAGYLKIFSDGPPKTFLPPVPQEGGLNGTWTYQGCFEDNLNNQRTLPWQLYFPETNSAELCLGKCAEFGYPVAGMEYGEECYCGDPIDVSNAGSTKRPESECNIVCSGNGSAICGGGSRLSLYQWTGETPLYHFDYPEGDDAGEYSNLVGGVVTPLMTMESITGKVTFLEKFGTGLANSTGAYELDLSQVGDFDAAWREMHVKTDIFCSAGVILPDKAGRQLTVGGWSGDSTYGVRLYWPDGLPGVPGVNDWEEDNARLRLQQGRWYPSAMVMSNGSILVIGGEIGANDRAVPTLEILPPTGTQPLYMEWLERTDPNNLYPFVCVLPGRGIFVQYWNEARILDEVTFATIKTLPNAPGSVTDNLAGRTYPLEGTAVLLPQHAPYNEPLGVLICGGATPGGIALDNCVSIQPDAPNAEWTLERMPSKRVMTCMSPLPDGTYLILNGAKQGVAGFGLADNPNYNAVLYDPTKPVNQRMSVMANTTVARLYHSEAITLLDGRVLVTGSDPQDGKHPQEVRVEVFTPPYLLRGGRRPSFTIQDRDWSYGHTASFQLGAAPVGALRISLLGAVSSTHGNSMGTRTLFPAFACQGTSCTVTAPPNEYIAPPGWYQMFVLEDGVPAVGTYVRIGGDPAELGNWPQGFNLPGI
ncbi:hypothetical protein DL771_001472 [Monosporascus sp. 5C6A]|nr:hypothetical protein DL771_001472 [Monosporascus sp. 5C6A]